MSDAWLLISDVDHTLLGDDEALAALARWRQSFAPGLRLAYASGRFFDSVRASIGSTRLPEPDAIIGGVGTEIRLYPDGTPLAGWRETLAAQFNADAVRRALAGAPRLRPQPAEQQSDLKVSYFLEEASSTELAALAQRLQSASIAANLIYSSRRDLDVLPASAGKGAAAAYLVDAWNVPTRRVVVAGDSGNDLSLFEQGFRGIVVGNAHEELRRLDGPLVYHASAAYAAGVREGLAHWLLAG